MFVVTLLLERGRGLDARTGPAARSLRAHPVHGRGLRLLPAHRESALEGADAHAPEAGPGLRPRRACSATQNPVDLDYKALSNIGTWFLGRLQTERDKERLIDGLLGASSDLDREQIERILSGVDKRVFMLHNVHEDRPALFRVRWAMSYLCGPLSRRQIKRLTADRPALPIASAPAEAPAAASAPAPKPKPLASARPVLPPGVPQCYLPLRGKPEGVQYQPHLVGLARVHFIDARRGLESSEELSLLYDLDDDGRVDWYEASETGLKEDELEDDPASRDAAFAELPEAAGIKKSYTAWRKSLADMLYRSRRYELMRSKAFDLVSKPGESERDFRIRLTDAAREERDAQSDKLRKRYAGKATTLENRIMRAAQKVEREREQAKQKKFDSYITVGTSLLGALLGRKKVSVTNLRRVKSAARGVGRVSKEKQDVERAEEQLLAYQRQLEDLNAELETEIEELAASVEEEMEELDTLKLKPRKTDIDVRVVALAWAPCREGEGGELEAAWG